MAVQILSDLHLEAPKAYDVFEIIPKAPYVALLGDIGNIEKHKDDCLAFLTKQLEQFRAVLFVPGNHEAYHSDWLTTLAILRAFEEDVRRDDCLGEFIVLDRTAYRLPDTNIFLLGCSLFSHVPSDKEIGVSLRLNDFMQTTKWDVDKHNEAHRRDLAWLNEKVAELEGTDVKIMIFSHWSPSLDARANDQKHTGSPITSAFATDLSSEPCFKSDAVKVWAFGHTHYNCDFEVAREVGVGTLRLLANQRGYYFAQADGFDREKVVGV